MNNLQSMYRLNATCNEDSECQKMTKGSLINNWNGKQLEWIGTNQNFEKSLV